MDESSLQEEMLIYLFSNYMSKKPKNARQIPEYLSLEEFKTTNTSIADAEANNYVKIHNAASKDLQTKKLKDVISKIALQAPAKKTLQALINLDKDITVDELISSSIDKIMQNPDADEEIRQKREEGLIDDDEEKLYSNYIKLFGEEKAKSGKFVKIKGKRFKENIKYIKIEEHDKLTESGSKVDYLKRLGFAPISVVESRATKKTGRKNLGIQVGGKGGATERESKISGGSLLSTPSNQFTKIFQRLFLQQIVSKEVVEAQKLEERYANYTNRKIQQLSRQKINSMKLFIGRLKRAEELTKPLKEDKFEIVLSPEDIAFNNKHFYPIKYKQAEGEETFATPSDKDLYDMDKDKYGHLKIMGEGEVTEITKVPELDSQGKQKKKDGKLQYHIKREGEKKLVGKKGEYIFPDFDDLADLGRIDYDDGKTSKFDLEFFQFERLKEIKETLVGAEEREVSTFRYEDEADTKVLDALKDLTKQAKVRQKEAESGLEALNESMQEFVKSKQLTVKEAKRAVQTGKLPENYRGKSFIDPKDGKKKKWNLKNFSELFGIDGEGRPDSEKKEFPMPTKEATTVTEKIKNLVTPKEAEDAYKNGLMDWIKRTFTVSLSDLNMLYEFEFQVVETIVDTEDGNKTSYSFSVAVFNPTHEINTKAANIKVGTDSQAGKQLGKPAYPYKNFKYDRNLIRDMKVFADSVKKKFKKLSSSLL